MRNKEIKKLAKEIVQQTKMENVNYSGYPMTEYEEKKQEDNTESKTVLDTKCEEAARYDIEIKNQQLYKEKYLYKELSQYKKELDKERKARKKVEEHQNDLKYLIKNLQNQLKEVEKNCQQLEKKQQKNYQKLKAGIKKKNKKQREKINVIKNVLRYMIYMSGLPFYGKSLKEIESFCKKESRHIKESRAKYIDCDYKEIH